MTNVVFTPTYFSAMRSPRDIFVDEITWPPGSRAKKILKHLCHGKSNIKSLLDLSEKTCAQELSMFKNCGCRTILEIAKVLKYFGLPLKLGRGVLCPFGPHYQEMMAILSKD